MAVACNGKTKLVFVIFILLIHLVWGRLHHVQLEAEVRQTIELSKFGFLKDGTLKVNFSDMIITDSEKRTDLLFGFSLEKTGSDGISPYMEQHSEKCILKDQSQLPSNANQISLAVIKFDLGQRHIVIDKIGSDFLNLTIDDKSSLLTTVTTMSASSTSSPVSPPTESSTMSTVPTSQEESIPKSNPASQPSKGNTIPITQAVSMTSVTENNLTIPSEGNNIPNSQAAAITSVVSTPLHSSDELHDTQVRQQKRRNVGNTQLTTPARSEVQTLPLYTSPNNVSHSKYSGQFVVQVKSKAEEGLYNLYFHNCPVPNKKRVPVTIQIDIVEQNGNNFLSAGEEPLPYMFGVLSALFFGTAIYWLHVLRKNREFTYKVHYMMFVLILLKAMDLMFQAVNYHIISKDGTPEESWEVLYYITHLLKGALLFTTIVLIGTGYFFIKHVLSDRDKKIFMIVIPLQILANTAQIVMESTEEANTQYTTWKELFILVDLLCCGAILFPVVWSIRHLQEGSQTDGKAALNLAKLKLFRHFYVMAGASYRYCALFCASRDDRRNLDFLRMMPAQFMTSQIVCYIYFTRIIVYLIKITVPFQYMWLDDFFNNAASYVFFVLTGYKFRPAPDNPYLHVPQGESDDEMEMEEVLTNAGLANGVTRLQPSSDGKRTFETA